MVSGCFLFTLDDGFCYQNRRALLVIGTIYKDIPIFSSSKYIASPQKLLGSGNCTDLCANVFNKKLRCTCQADIFGCGDADVAALPLIKAFAYDMIAGIVCNQGVGDTDAQTALNHRKKCMVTADLVPHGGLIRCPVEKMCDLKVSCFVELDKGRVL